METLGGILKKYRLVHKLTLRQVQDATGISNAYLSQLENNKIAKPSAQVLFVLANLYLADLTEFLMVAGIITNTETIVLHKNALFYPIQKEVGCLTQGEISHLLDYLLLLRNKT